EEDLKNFLQYVKTSMNQGRSLNYDSLTYYEPILEDFMAQLNRRKDLIASYNVPFDFKTMRSLFGYQTHIHQKGWCSWVSDDQVSNDLNQKRDIQAIKINFPAHKVYYSVYYNENEGWSEEVAAPEIAGTTGESKAIFGIKIRLDEAGAKEFDILYRVHKFDGEWTDWAKNGEVIYSYEQKLNAIQIKLESKT
ncbi:MAG: hypothetical protein J5497_06475, partial [Selenomonadaceae bacterium]|nr:hypothetical protein [Selenomonadaceae bacterium]